MKYSVKYDVACDGVNISFPDIPEAISCSETLNNAPEMARDALYTALEFYFEGGRKIPEPSCVSTNFISVESNMVEKIRRHNL